MTRGNGKMEASDSAACLAKVMDGVTMENSGTFWHGPNGKVYAW